VNEPSSTNDLSFSPRFISYHLQAKHLRDTLSSLGPGAQAYFVDIKDCFRNQWTHPSDWHLFVIHILGKFYVDTRHTFGNVVSEWSWQAILAILRWGLPRMGVLDQRGVASSTQSLDHYVDNMFLLSSNSDPSHLARLERLHQILTGLGLPLHEEQFGPVVNALGWDWDLVGMTMSCPEDKYYNIVNHLKKWQSSVARGHPLRCKQVEKLIGFMNWVTTACPSLSTKIGALRASLTKAVKQKKPTVALDPAGKHALQFMLSFFSLWDRSSTIFHDFSPCHSWDHLIRVDASTTFGAGGFTVPLGVAFSSRWSDEDRALALHIAPLTALPAFSASHASDMPPGQDPSALLRESTTVFELLGVLEGLRRLGSLMRGSRVQIELDNQVAVLGLKTWFSPTASCLSVLDRIHSLVISLSLTLRVEFIPRIHNHIADALSLNDLLQAQELFRSEFGLLFPSLALSFLPAALDESSPFPLLTSM